MSRYSYRHRYERYSMFPQSKSKGERIADAAKKRRALKKKGVKLSPVVLEGFAITKTFWGKSWCKNIESYHDYANRLPRGRSYVRSNSVIDLQIVAGSVNAKVMGTSLYKVEISIKPIVEKRWEAIRRSCVGKIGTLMELLRGSISGEVMEIMTRKGEGLFPEPMEISFKCSCPDGAYMCKHIAASMYGIGNRLDSQPELLFLLRGVDSADLIEAAVDAPSAAGEIGSDETLDAGELAGVFGIDMEVEAAPSGKSGKTKSFRQRKTADTKGQPKPKPKTKSKPKPKAKAKAKDGTKPKGKAKPGAKDGLGIKPHGAPKNRIIKKSAASRPRPQ